MADIPASEQNQTQRRFFLFEDGSFAPVVVVDNATAGVPKTEIIEDVTANPSLSTRLSDIGQAIKRIF